MLSFLIACSGSPSDTPDTPDTPDTGDALTSPACEALTLTAAATTASIDWSVEGADVADAALHLDVAGYRFRLPQSGTAGTDVRLPASGLHTTADLTLSVTLTDGTVCDSAPQTISLQASTPTTFDDPVTVVEIDAPASAACEALLLETIQPASSHLGDPSNDAAFRIRHPCTGLVFLTGLLTPSDLSSLGLSESGWLAEVSYLPAGHDLSADLCTDQGCFVATMETVPGLVPGTLLYFDPLTGALLDSQQTWTEDAPATADLHHGLRMIGSDSTARSLGWTSHSICESDYPSAIRTDVDLATAQVTDRTEDALNTNAVSCDSLDGAPYHYYGNSLGDAEVGGESGTCSTFIDLGSNTSGGFVHCEVGSREIIILQESMNPIPISPEADVERWVMPQINPFLHAVSLWQDPTTETMHLFLLTLGDPEDGLEAPTVYAMTSSEVTSGVEQRTFTTACTHTFDAAEDPARHHSSVFPLSDDTLFALYARGDATDQAVLLDLQTCQSVGHLRTDCGAACTSSDKRYPRWAQRLEGYPLSVTALP